jgi:hypothetical protein
LTGALADPYLVAMRKVRFGSLMSAVATVAALVFVPSAEAKRTCSSLHLQATTIHVSVQRGSASCSTARRVLSVFLSGGGTMHGPANGPSYKQWWSVEGWHCGTGAGGGACIRGGSDATNARDYIVGVA